MKFSYINLLIAFVIITLFSMCKKDLGNYAYQGIPELRIDTTGTSGPFTIKQSIQELVIHPKVAYTGNKTLDYYWVWGDTFNDTIARKKDLQATLNWPISPTAYRLTFQVVERETGNMSAVQYMVYITGSTGRGWMVAHEKDGTADIDLINTPTEAQSPVLRNIHATINGSRLPGKVTGLGTVGDNNLFMFMTDKSMSLMRADGMVRQFADEEVFGLLKPDAFKPEAFAFKAGNINYLINNGQLYQNLIGNFSPGLMTQRIVTADGSDYKLAPVYMMPNTKGGIFVDLLGKRFLQVGAVTTNTFLPVIAANTTARFSLSRLDRKFLFGKKGFQLYTGFLETLSNTTLYAFFADESGPGRYLYVAGMETPAAPDFAMIDISAAPEIQNASFYDVFESSPCVYYATENKLYLLQVNPGGNSYVNGGVQFTPPAGEIITCIRIDRVGAVNPLFYYIATYNPATGQGTVYQYSIATGTGVLSASPVKTWTGFGGKITMMDWKRY